MEISRRTVGDNQSPVPQRSSMPPRRRPTTTTTNTEATMPCQRNWKSCLSALVLLGVLAHSFFFEMEHNTAYLLQMMATNDDSIYLRHQSRGETWGGKCKTDVQFLELDPPECAYSDEEDGRASNFESIYKRGTWGHQTKDAKDFYGNAQWPPPPVRGKSASGPGSDLGYNTENSLRIITDAIKKYNISTMVDVPCGDTNWVFDSFVTDVQLDLYLGLDVVRPVIEINSERFRHHRNKHFLFWDAGACRLPKYRFRTNDTGPWQTFDMAHVRDVIQHLPLQRGVQFFCNLFASGVKILIATTHPRVGHNRNIGHGDYYLNNLAKEPFSFPNDIECVPTHPKLESDSTCIYLLEGQEWVAKFLSQKCPTPT